MKKYLPIILIVAVFIFSSFLSQRYSAILQEIISQYKLFGLLVYTILTILAIVIAPLTSIPFIPLAVETWGVFLTIISSVIGWTIGSLGAFWVARRYGVPIVKRFVVIDNTRNKFYAYIKKENTFWYLIFLRMVIPVDILSYMLGLFTDISWKMFIITTFLGIIPVVLLLSFFGTFPIEYQVLLFIVGIVLLAVFLLVKNKFFKK